MYFVIVTELGIVVSQDNTVAKSFAFSNPAAEFVEAKKGELKNNSVFDYLQGLNAGFFVSDEPLLKMLKKAGLDVQPMSEKQTDEIQANKPQVLVDAGFAKNVGDAIGKLREFALSLSSSKVTEVSQSPDMHIIQAIGALDELDVMINGLSSRLREWYGLHFPELDNIIDSINGYAQIVMAGKRTDLSDKVYQDAGFPDSKVQMLSVIQQKSKGGDISPENLAMIQSIASQILEMTKARNAIEHHIEEQMKTIAPNIAAILGTAVGARILAKAGSIKKLATLPASTIQVLGAEKALFRALKTGTQPPKHGILFQHPTVHASPRWQRGKMARAIASKAAIAARVDVYGAGLNQTLIDKLNVRVTEIGEKYKEPTERAPQPQRMERRREDFGRRDRFGGRDRKPRDRDDRPRDRPTFRDRDDKPRDSFRNQNRDRPSFRDDKPRENFRGRDRDDRPSFRDRDDKPRDSFRNRDDKPRDSFRSRDRPTFRDRDDKPSFRDRDSRRDGFRSRGDSDSPRREFRGDSGKRKKFGKRKY
ncbi:MAG: ribonucleotide-diphosphate reductase subunit beta [Nitrosopumilaceae archaeon]|nr:ribonucleotide-diphosphate reductase subunit beta [Nitrosopumilaceae archaeon]